MKWAEARGQSSSPDAGFTLIEMLVSLALLALITATLAQMIYGARRALTFVDRTSAAAPVFAVQTYLRRALEQARAGAPQAVGDQSSLSLSGDVDHVAFTTTYAPQGTYQGLYRINIGVAPNSHGGFDLVADQELYRPAPDDTAPRPRRSATLLANVSGVTFSYFKPEVDEGEPHWRADWAQAGSLPRLISIEVRFPRGDVRAWETMTVPLGGAVASAVNCPPRVNCD